MSMKLHRMLGKNIRFWREARGFTQEELAFRAQTSSSYISKMELGKENPTITVLERIAKALAIDPCMLLLNTCRCAENATQRKSRYVISSQSWRIIRRRLIVRHPKFNVLYIHCWRRYVKRIRMKQSNRAAVLKRKTTGVFASVVFCCLKQHTVKHCVCIPLGASFTAAVYMK